MIHVVAGKGALWRQQKSGPQPKIRAHLNPNVFYEIGIAHTLGREVILITQSGADIPFDLQHLRKRLVSDA